MALYLVQHGRNLSAEQDPERGLSPQGRSEVERIAAVAGEYSVKVSRIRHSGKKRARQTAEIFAWVLQPPGGIEEAGGLNPLDDVTPVAHAVRDSEDVMLVGHMPFMTRLTSLLITGAIEPAVFKFQNGGIVCLGRDGVAGPWLIVWTLMPHIGGIGTGG